MEASSASCLLILSALDCSGLLTLLEPSLQVQLLSIDGVGSSIWQVSPDFPLLFGGAQNYNSSSKRALETSVLDQ